MPDCYGLRAFQTKPDQNFKGSPLKGLLFTLTHKQSIGEQDGRLYYAIMAKEQSSVYEKQIQIIKSEIPVDLGASPSKY